MNAILKVVGAAVANVALGLVGRLIIALIGCCTVHLALDARRELAVHTVAADAGTDTLLQTVGLLERLAERRNLLVGGRVALLGSNAIVQLGQGRNASPRLFAPIAIVLARPDAQLGASAARDCRGDDAARLDGIAHAILANRTSVDPCLLAVVIGDLVVGIVYGLCPIGQGLWLILLATCDRRVVMTLFIIGLGLDDTGLFCLHDLADASHASREGGSTGGELQEFGILALVELEHLGLRWTIRQLGGRCWVDSVRHDDVNGCGHGPLGECVKWWLF